VCPAHLKERLDTHTKKLKAFLRSFSESKVCLKENCFYDLVPKKFLINYFGAKNDITEHVFENYERPFNYKYLRDLSRLLSQIKHRELNIDLSQLRDTAHTVQTKNFMKKIQQSKHVCDYNIFGTKTGRLTTMPGTFPILTMDKKYRSIIKPHNDWFLELDFNAAELRTMLSMTDNAQPALDIHEWNAKHIWNGKKDRQEAKKSIFAWLYNPKSSDKAPNKYYDRDFLLSKHYDTGTVLTPFGREMPVDRDHAVNYLIQGTTAELALRQLIRIWKYLTIPIPKPLKSFIAFTMHDSVVIDLCHEERYLIPSLIYTYSATDMGEYVVNASAGRDFGNMRALNR
jgi:hypothetical protein